ncbi:replication initiation regulator SeqA [Gilliamella sp. Pas-s95]|uniref:replication initiation regulator SeqA n=1 Tax=Gilliamella sp. Pas-s95 TaxID=2687317 RepID=UPI001328A4CF|nr:replication initiation regulator SeqA [Gilliamella sp. Pas-s95]MWN06002.1 replication initiation regulator SeqA [Gilliamella sp. Pas-s95]
MKTIEIDEELYQFIAGQTKHIGENASSILRRLLKIDQPTLAKQNIIAQKESHYTPFNDLLTSDTFTNEKSIINRFILLLSALYNYNPALFAIAATSLHGSKRQYLAKDKQLLETSGKNTKPREIIGTPYWVISNTNTARKQYIIESIMSDMGISETMINQVTNAFLP